MKISRRIVAGALLTMTGAPQAFGQNDPVPGYYELQVAYCWGMYNEMIPENNAIVSQECAPNYKQTAIANCESGTKENAEWQDQTNALRDYLLTGTADHGGNAGVAIAITRGKKFADDLFNGNPDLSVQEVKDRSAECIDVIKELPY